MKTLLKVVGLLLLLGIGLVVTAGVWWKRNEPAVIQDVAYSKAGDPTLYLDIYKPSVRWTSPRPAVVLVHGGGWAAGSRADNRDLAQALARFGYTAFSIQYRLVSETANKWPAQLDDCQRAVRWVRAHAAEYGIDPARVGALGGSAGGHLVACLGLLETRDNSDPLLASFSSRATCVVDLAGPTDLVETLAGKVPQGEWADGLVCNLLGVAPEQRAAAGQPASPLFLIDHKTAPFLIFHGRQDDIVPVDHAERMHAALLAAGRESQLEVVESGHGFNNAESMQRFVIAAKAFLERHLKP